MRHSCFFFDMIREDSRWKGERKMKIFCCEECVEIALDTIVDKCETFPIFTKLDVDNLSTTCEYCPEPATYVVANE